MASLLNLFRRPRAAATAQMAAADAAIIRRYAEGENHLHEQAIAIHRQYIPLLGVRGTPEQRFMAEVDHPDPDPLLRSLLRTDLLDANRATAESR